MRKRCTEKRIIGFLRESGVCLPIKALCRKQDLSESGYDAWLPSSAA